MVDNKNCDMQNSVPLCAPNPLISIRVDVGHVSINSVVMALTKRRVVVNSHDIKFFSKLV